jgi:hypothetical protein
MKAPLFALIYCYLRPGFSQGAHFSSEGRRCKTAKTVKTDLVLPSLLALNLLFIWFGLGFVSILAVVRRGWHFFEGRAPIPINLLSLGPPFKGAYFSLEGRRCKAAKTAKTAKVSTCFWVWTRFSFGLGLVLGPIRLFFWGAARFFVRKWALFCQEMGAFDVNPPEFPEDTRIGMVGVKTAKTAKKWPFL